MLVMPDAPTQNVTPERLVGQVKLWRGTALILAVVALFLVVVLVGQLTQRPVTTTPGGASAASDSGFVLGQDSSSDAGDTGSQPTVDPARRDLQDTMAIGDINAPVTLIEWADYRCPFCAAFANDTLPQVIAEYVDSGKVRIEFNDVVMFGDQSMTAAIAARAAARQGYYKEFTRTLYAAAPRSGHPDMPRETLIGFAQDAGVPDLAQFAADLDDEELRDQVGVSTRYAQSIGVTGVPHFMLDGQSITGAQSIETFRELIDARLAQAGQ